jgi:hypothetical protein
MADMIDALNVDALRALPDDAPVTMLNRMRFGEGSAAFIEMMQSSNYQLANVERENGCADHATIAVRETDNKWAKA